MTVEISRKTQAKKQHIRNLLNRRDPKLFKEGGCHIFAMALQRRFGYVVFGIRKQGGAFSHVYCLGTNAAVDADGKRPENDILFEYQEYEGEFSRPASLSNRVKLDFDSLSEEEWESYALLSEPGFVDDALAFAYDYIAATESEYANA